MSAIGFFCPVALFVIQGKSHKRSVKARQGTAALRPQPPALGGESLRGARP